MGNGSQLGGSDQAHCMLENMQLTDHKTYKTRRKAIAITTTITITTLFTVTITMTMTITITIAATVSITTKQKAPNHTWAGELCAQQR